MPNIIPRRVIDVNVCLKLLVYGTSLEQRFSKGLIGMSKARMEVDECSMGPLQHKATVSIGNGTKKYMIIIVKIFFLSFLVSLNI